MESGIGTKYIRSYGIFSEATKQEVVEAVVRRKLSRTEACSRYGIKGHSTIQKWIEKYQSKTMKQAKNPSRLMSKPSENLKLHEEKKQLEQALLKATVKVHCLELIIEEAEARYGIDFKKTCIQRS